MRFVLLLIAAVIAIIAGVVALQMSDKKAADGGAPVAVQTDANVSTVEVLVARQPIAVGTAIEEGMVDKQPWPRHLVLDGFIVAGSRDSNLAGKVARAPFAEREPFMANKLANPNDPSFLAANLPEGMRAVTMGVDPISGIAGYVFPGDRVDVLLTHSIRQEIRNRQKPMASQRIVDKPDVSEVLVPDVRVLAVNVRSAGKDTAQTAAAPSNVTLEVSEQQAQQIRLAEKVGSLSLALRSIKDQDKERPRPSTVEYLTKVRIFGTQGDGVRVVRGPGGDSDAPSAGGMLPALGNPPSAAAYGDNP